MKIQAATIWLSPKHSNVVTQPNNQYDPSTYCIIPNNETIDNDKGIINNLESTSNNDIDSASAQNQPVNASTSLVIGFPEPNHNTTSIVTRDADEAIESEDIAVPSVTDDNCFGIGMSD